MAGYDLTFTPVKSVSALWALAPLEIAKTIEDCHHKAVADTLAFLESQACFSRMGTNGVAQVDTTGFIAAAFDHRDSRAGDPNLHTHVAVSNKVCAIGPDGIPRWLALDGQPLYKAKVSASELYNTLCEANSDRRTRASASPTTPTNRASDRSAKSSACQRELIEVWSSRRAAIEHRVGQLAKDFQERPRTRADRGGDAGPVPASHAGNPGRQARATVAGRAAPPVAGRGDRRPGRPPRTRRDGRRLTSGRAARERVTVTDEWVAEQAAQGHHHGLRVTLDLADQPRPRRGLTGAALHRPPRHARAGGAHHRLPLWASTASR